MDQLNFIIIETRRGLLSFKELSMTDQMFERMVVNALTQ